MSTAAARIAVLLAFAGSLACATSFSPQTVRAEIERQTGADPSSMFEVNLGRMTLGLARTVIGKRSDGTLPLAGLKRFELAVYGLPPAGGDLDFTRMTVRGWEPTVRAKRQNGSTLVLIRQAGDAIGDLVLVAADEKQAVYARLTGSLSAELPVALGEAVARRGTDGVRAELMALTETAGSGGELAP